MMFFRVFSLVIWRSFFICVHEGMSLKSFGCRMCLVQEITRRPNQPPLLEPGENECTVESGDSGIRMATTIFETHWNRSKMV
jgi:hypothetical protein